MRWNSTADKLRHLYSLNASLGHGRYGGIGRGCGRYCEVAARHREEGLPMLPTTESLQRGWTLVWIALISGLVACAKGSSSKAIFHPISINIFPEFRPFSSSIRSSLLWMILGNRQCKYIFFWYPAAKSDVVAWLVTLRSETKTLTFRMPSNQTSSLIPLPAINISPPPSPSTPTTTRTSTSVDPTVNITQMTVPQEEPCRDVSKKIDDPVYDEKSVTIEMMMECLHCHSSNHTSSECPYML